MLLTNECKAKRKAGLKVEESIKKRLKGLSRLFVMFYTHVGY